MSTTRHRLTLHDTCLIVDETGTNDTNAPVIVWLHGEFGEFDGSPFPQRVINNSRGLTFHHPGWGVSTGGTHLDRVSDIATAYLWALDQLGIREPVVAAGHGFGATIALELAIQQPERFNAVVAACAFGIWDDQIGGEDIFGLTPGDARKYLYVDPSSSLAERQFPQVKDPHERGLQSIRRAQTLGAASRYLFPIPDTGISGRLYRLTANDIALLWGEQDGFVPPEMSKQWANWLPNATNVVVDGTAHMLPYEKDTFGALVAEKAAL